MQQIDTITQQNSDSAEETASVSAEMNSHVGKLQQVVERFKLRNMQSTVQMAGYVPKTKINSSNWKPSKMTVVMSGKTSEENWGGGTATAVLSNEGDSDYNFKLDDIEFGKL